MKVLIPLIQEAVLVKYGFWFLDNHLQCDSNQVQKAISSVKKSQVLFLFLYLLKFVLQVPRVISSSKEREAIVLKIGELMNQIPIFGHFSSIYGGLASLYLQIF